MWGSSRDWVDLRAEAEDVAGLSLDVRIDILVILDLCTLFIVRMGLISFLPYPEKHIIYILYIYIYIYTTDCC